MKTKRTTLIVITFAFTLYQLLLCQSSNNSHLEPEDGPFGMIHSPEYYDNIRRVIYRPIEGRIMLQMVTIPSFRPEEAIGIFETKGGKKYVFTVQSKVHLWQYESLKYMKQGQERIIYSPQDSNNEEAQRKEIEKLEKSIPKNIDDVQVNYKKYPISDELYNVIYKTWLTILKRVHYGSNGAGLDGVMYHFSAFELGQGDLCGQTWSPDEGTVNGLSVQLGSLLANYVYSNKKEDAEKQIKIVCDDILNKCSKD